MEEHSLSPAAIIDQFKRNGVTHVVWLPDTETNFMYQQIIEDDNLNLVPICREGESMPIAAGLWIGGKKPVVLIQNTGAGHVTVYRKNGWERLTHGDVFTVAGDA